MIALIAFTARLAAAEPSDDFAEGADGAAAEITVAETAGADSAPAEIADDESAMRNPDWSDAGAADDREAARHQAPTRLGRLDLTITWRRTVRTSEVRTIDARRPVASPLDPVTTARGELWFVATWRL